FSSLVRRGAVTAEGARDLVEAIDLGENLVDVLLEHAVEIDAFVGARSAKVLDAKPNGREWILDFVRHLTCPLAPRPHALRSRHLGPVVESDDSTARREPRQRTPKLHLVERQL